MDFFGTMHRIQYYKWKAIHLTVNMGPGIEQFYHAQHVCIQINYRSAQVFFSFPVFIFQCLRSVIFFFNKQMKWKYADIYCVCVDLCGVQSGRCRILFTYLIRNSFWYSRQQLLCFMIKQSEIYFWKKINGSDFYFMPTKCKTFETTWLCDTLHLPV